jgi:hypothetical protein
MEAFSMALSSNHFHETSGIVPRLMARVFGERAARLTERLQRVHWLSYLLVVSQSVAVILVLGHAELPLLFDASWAIRALASMGVFVLVATVVSADLALLETLRRVPVLARNRQSGQLREHLAYVLFVLLIEASTYAVVLAVLDSNPRALITSAPLIPNAGPVFVAQVILRAVLVCWTAVQLVIVRGRLPILLSTLTATGKEIVGAHVERRLAGLDIAGISLPAGFRVYAAMSKPPRRIRTWWNGWLVNRELAAEAEEDRQVQNVIGALDDLERRRITAEAAPAGHITQLPAESSPVALPAHAYTAPDAPEKPPTGPGAPSAAKATRRASGARAQRPQVLMLTPDRPVRQAARARSHASPVRTPRMPIMTATPAKDRAAAVWRPGMSVDALERAAGISRSSAARYRAEFTANPPALAQVSQDTAL